METKQVAIYLDFENIAISAGEVYRYQTMPVKMEPIVSYAEAKGRLRVKKVYADWSKKKFSQYQKNLMVQGFELVHLPETNLLGKNGSDMRLVVDVMDHIQTFPEIETVIIGSGDSDFIPLLQYLQSKNKEVIIIGFDHSVSDVIKHYCSEFRSLEEIIGSPDKPSGPSPRQEARARGVLRKLIRDHGVGPFSMDRVKKELLELVPKFSPRMFGFSSVKKMLKSFEGDVVERIEKKEGKKVEVTFSLTTAHAKKVAAEKELEIQKKRKSPAFKKAQVSLRSWISSLEAPGPLPLSRVKSGLLRVDDKFSEKKLGFSSFKQFAMAMVGEVFDKIELNDSTLLVHFKSQEIAIHTQQSPVQVQAKSNGNGAAPGRGRNGLSKTQSKESATEKQPKPARTASNAQGISRAPKSTNVEKNIAQKDESPIAKAQKMLKEDLFFLPDSIFRQELGAGLIAMFEGERTYNMAQLKEALQTKFKGTLNEGQVVKYLLTLKFGGALMSDERHGKPAEKLLYLKDGINQSETLDFLYIEQISDVLKKKFAALTNSQILDLLFS